MPDDGRLPRTVRFLHDPVVLRTHLDLGPGNPLALGPGIDAALARYRKHEAQAVLILVRYATEAAAAAAAADARAALLGGLLRAVRDERGSWRALTCAGREVAVVVDAGSEALAGELLAKALPAPKTEARP
jgi:hypothetical protein